MSKGGRITIQRQKRVLITRLSALPNDLRLVARHKKLKTRLPALLNAGRRAKGGDYIFCDIGDISFSLILLAKPSFLFKAAIIFFRAFGFA
jgi:hypothetical protein